MASPEHAEERGHCDQVLTDMRRRLDELLDQMKRLQGRHASFADQQKLLREHSELLAGQRAMLKYRQAHPL